MRVLLMLLAWLLAADAALAERRVALAIGNNAYPNLDASSQLTRAVNDMEAVAAGLERIGFSVIKAPNADRQALFAKLDELVSAVGPGDTVLFFYAGHGVAIDGINYLLPTDIPDASSARLVAASAVSEPEIVKALSERQVKVAIVVLDACRNNPLAAGGTRALGAERGLTRLPAEPPGIFGIYAASSGQTALDRLGDDDKDPNSVFTRIFIKELTEEGGSLIDVAYRLQKEVAELAASVGHEQRPVYYDQARGRDIRLTDIPTKPEDLAPPAVVAAVEAEAREKAAPAAALPLPDAREMGAGAAPGCDEADAHFAAAVRLNLPAAFEEHIRRFGACATAEPARVLLGRAAGSPEAGVDVALKPEPAFGALLATIKGPRERINGLAVSPDGRTIATASSDAAVRLWRVDDGTLLHAFEKLGKPAYTVAFSPDGKRVAGGLWNHTIRVWDVESGELLYTLKGHADEVYAVVFSPDGQTLVSSSEDKTVRTWDVATGAAKAVIKGFPGKVTAIALAPDGRTLAVGASDRLIRLVDLSTGKRLRPLGEHDDTVYALAFGPDGKRIASGAEDGRVRIWDAATGEVLHDLEGHGDEVYSVAFSPDGKTLASGSEDRSIILWNAETGARLAALKGHGGVVQSLAVLPDGSRLLSASRDRTVRIWSLANPGAVADR